MSFVFFSPHQQVLPPEPLPNKPVFRSCCCQPLPRPSLQLRHWLLQRLQVIVWWRQDAEGVGGQPWDPGLECKTGSSCGLAVSSPTPTHPPPSQPPGAQVNRDSLFSWRGGKKGPHGERKDGVVWRGKSEGRGEVSEVLADPMTTTTPSWHCPGSRSHSPGPWTERDKLPSPPPQPTLGRSGSTSLRLSFPFSKGVNLRGWWAHRTGEVGS